MHRQLSVHYSCVNSRWNIAPLLEGDLDNVPLQSSRTIRIFLSSTFSDTTSERNALMERVYPSLKEFCRQYRLEFQVIDLRWGIRDQSHDDHTIIEFCLKEIDNCRKLSLGVNFVILMGQKYGYRPFPPKIDAAEFETIRRELERLKTQERELLDAWFKKNSNVKPEVWILQPISILLPDYINKEDPEKQKKADQKWSEIYSSIQKLLRIGVQSCINTHMLPNSVRDKYFISVTEYEIEKGLLNSPEAAKNCLCFTRHIENLQNELKFNKNAARFIDVRNGGKDIDDEAQTLLSVLQNDKIRRVLPDQHSLRFDLSWPRQLSKDQLPTDDEKYLDQFCQSFKEKIQWLIEKSVGQSKSVTCHSQVLEIAQHLEMCKARCRIFKGREKSLIFIRSYLEEDAGPKAEHPLVIYGESGSGKTSVIAKVASCTKRWMSSIQQIVKPVIVVRFLGTTSHSCSIRLVLASICWQITSAYKKDKLTELPEDYLGLVSYFNDILKVASPRRPIVLLLDGLDQLTEAHRAHGLAWLPRALPKHVRLVVSTLPNRYEILETVKLIFPANENFLEVTPLGSQLSINMVKEWLFSSGRTLTPEQFKVVESALTMCSLPLYMTLVFKEVSRWCSYTPIDQTQLEATVPGIVNQLFDRIELYYGYTFVAHALSYLTASKNGLSDIELEDLLSLDDEVLNDVFQHWLPPVRRIPPLLIPRLLDELSSYIMQREANETIVYYWYHNQFIEVAKTRYLTALQHRLSVHRTLAHYFLGTWGGGRAKPFRYSQKQIEFLKIAQPEGEADRKVPQQPLEFGVTKAMESKVLYNHRKLSELPHHLAMAKMYVELSKYVLFNYDWLHAKLSASSLHDVLADFYQITTSYETDIPQAVVADAQLMANALRVGGNCINQSPDTLAFDIMGRLILYYDRGDPSQEEDSVNITDNSGRDNGEHCLAASPATVAVKTVTSPGVRPTASQRAGYVRRIRRSRHDNIRSLLQQCDTKSLRHSALLPLGQCFEAPTTMSLYVLEAHSKIITSLVFSSATNELISASQGQIIFWDIKTGELNRSLDISRATGGMGRISLYMSNDCKLLIVDTDTLDSPVYIYDIKSLHLLHQCGCRTAALRRVFLAGDFLCRQRSIINIRTGTVVKSMDDFVPSKYFLPCAISPNCDSILIADGEVTQLFDFRTHLVLAEVPSKYAASVLCFSNDGKFAFIGYMGDCNVLAVNVERIPKNNSFGSITMRFSPEAELLSAGSNGGRAFMGNEICGIKTHPEDTELILVNINEFNVIVLNIVSGKWTKMTTEGIKEMIQPRKLSIKEALFVGEGRFVMACVDRFVQLWSQHDGLLLGSIRLHTMPGFPICTFQNHIATGSTIHTSLNVWDLNGLFESRPEPEIKVYKSSVECLAVVPQKRLVFVRNSFPNNSGEHLKYLNSFGIDVWNIGTGTCKELLPFNKYGKLAQMEVSQDASNMALLLNAVRDWYVTIFRIENRPSNGNSPNGLRFFLHHNCSSFSVCSNWRYLATSSQRSISLDDRTSHEFKVWNIDTGREMMCIRQGSNPVFTLDGTSLAYIDVHLDKTVVLHSLVTMESLGRIPCHAASIQMIPARRDCILITSSTETKFCRVYVWNFKSVEKLVEFGGVEEDGIRDISKDGIWCVDGSKQIFNLFDGTGINSFATLHQNDNVRLTDDGKYVIWTDELSVKVGRVSDGVIVANTSTHESPSCLYLMDHGYIIVLGRKDGHLLTMKLSVETEYGKVSYRPQNVVDRRHFLLDTLMCSEKSVSIMDSLFQTSAECISDDLLPSINDTIRQTLLDRANVPHTVITTEEVTDSSSSSHMLHCRRGSSPGAHISEMLKKYHTPLAMTALADHLSGPRKSDPWDSESSSSQSSPHSTLQRRKSRSLQDINKTRKSDPPTSPHRSGTAWLSKLIHKPLVRLSPHKNKAPKDFRVRKGLERTGMMMVKTLNIPVENENVNHLTNYDNGREYSHENGRVSDHENGRVNDHEYDLENASESNVSRFYKSISSSSS